MIDRLKSISSGPNDVLFSFNSGDFLLLAILSSWIVLLMLFQWGVLQNRFSKSYVCTLTLSLQERKNASSCLTELDADSNCSLKNLISSKK